MDITSYLLGRKSSGGGSNMHYVVVEELPTTGEEGYVYLVPKSTSKTNNYYDEYMYINNDWELIGNTEIDLSDYQKTIQYAVVPNATADNLGKIIQYIGTTTNDYTNGYFYECVSDGQDPAIYSWSNIGVQASNEIIIDTQTTSSQATLDRVSNFITKNLNKVVHVIVINGLNYVIDGYMNINPILSNYGIQKIEMLDYNATPSSIFIVGSWNNGVYTASAINSISFSSAKQALSVKNTRTFTPTANYHPATKKYVDDSIASAITDALGGSY